MVQQHCPFQSDTVSLRLKCDHQMCRFTRCKSHSSWKINCCPPNKIKPATPIVLENIKLQIPGDRSSKFTLQQVMKTQTWSKGVALLFL
jgi:hypothetical protein